MSNVVPTNVLCNSVTLILQLPCLSLIYHREGHNSSEAVCGCGTSEHIFVGLQIRDSSSYLYYALQNINSKLINNINTVYCTLSMLKSLCDIMWHMLLLCTLGSRLEHVVAAGDLASFLYKGNLTL